MGCAIDKLTYADGRAYRYQITDEEGNLCLVAERAGLRLPSPTCLVEFFGTDRSLSGRLQPLDVRPLWATSSYVVFAGGEYQRSQAVICRQWRLVDILLLRLPRYNVQLGEHLYVLRGSRYGGNLYEILRPCRSDERGSREDKQLSAYEGGPSRRGEVRVGQISRPATGSSYVVETIAAPLRNALLVLVAVVILIDMEMFS